MTPRAHPGRTAGFGLVALMAIIPSGCGHSPTTHFYTLDPVAPAAAGVATGAPFRLDAVHLPPAFDRPEFVRETAANTIVIDDFSKWAAPLGETAQRVLTQDLIARLPAGRVIFPSAPKPSGSDGLVVDILAIGETDAEATLDVSWTWLAGRATTAGTVAVRTRPLRVSVPRQGEGAAARAAQLSQMLGRVADAIANDPPL